MTLPHHGLTRITAVMTTVIGTALDSGVTVNGKDLYIDKVSLESHLHVVDPGGYM